MYCLTTKRFCTYGGDITGYVHPSHFCVSITLMSAIALGGILLAALFFAGVAGKSLVIPVSIAVSVEQVVMLMVFLTSTKIRTKLQGCFERKET